MRTVPSDDRELLYAMRSLGRQAPGARLERMRGSPQWAGGQFVNVHPIIPGLRDPAVPMPTLKEFLCGGERRVPVHRCRRWIRSTPGRRPGERPARHLVGHSTVLLEIGGVRVLTDPSGEARLPVQPRRTRASSRPVPLRSCRRSIWSSSPTITTITWIIRASRAGEDQGPVRDLARGRRAPGGLGRAARPHHGAGLVGVIACRERRSRSPPRPRSILRARTQRAAIRPCGPQLVLRSERHAVFFSGDTGLTT